MELVSHRQQGGLQLELSSLCVCVKDGLLFDRCWLWIDVLQQLSFVWNSFFRRVVMKKVCPLNDVASWDRLNVLQRTILASLSYHVRSDELTMSLFLCGNIAVFRLLNRLFTVAQSDKLDATFHNILFWVEQGQSASLHVLTLSTSRNFVNIFQVTA